MNGRSFLGTNIVIYAHTDLDPEKKRITQQLITSQQDTFISTQVLQELINTLSKKFRLSWTDVALVVEQIKSYNSIAVNAPSTIDVAILVAVRYNYSFTTAYYRISDRKQLLGNLF